MSYLGKMCEDIAKMSMCPEPTPPPPPSSGAGAASSVASPQTAPEMPADASPIERQLHLTFHQILAPLIWRAGHNLSLVPYVPDYTVADPTHVTQFLGELDAATPTQVKEYGNAAWRQRGDLVAQLATMAAGSDARNDTVARAEMSAFVAHLAFTKGIAMIDAVYGPRAKEEGKLTLAQVQAADRLLLSQLYSNRSMVGMALLESAVTPDATAHTALLDAVRALIYLPPAGAGVKPYHRAIVAATKLRLPDLAREFAQVASSLPEARADSVIAALIDETLGRNLPTSAPCGAKGDSAVDAAVSESPTPAAQKVAPVSTAARIRKLKADLVETMRALMASPTSPELRKKMFGCVKSFDKLQYLTQSTGDAAVDVELVGALGMMAQLFPPSANPDSPGSHLPGWIFNVTSRNRLVGLKPEASGSDKPFADTVLHSLWLENTLALAKHCTNTKTCVNDATTRVLQEVAVGARANAVTATQRFLAAYVLIASIQNEKVVVSDPAAVELLQARRALHNVLDAEMSDACSENAGNDRMCGVLRMLHATGCELRGQLEGFLASVEGK